MYAQLHTGSMRYAVQVPEEDESNQVSVLALEFIQVLQYSTAPGC